MTKNCQKSSFAFFILENKKMQKKYGTIVFVGKLQKFRKKKSLVNDEEFQVRYECWFLVDRDHGYG